MGSLSIWHWLIVVLVIVLLFGTGKVSNLMGDFAKGIKAFKKNMEDDTPDASMEASAGKPSATLSAPAAAPAQTAASAPQNTAAHQG